MKTLSSAGSGNILLPRSILAAPSANLASDTASEVDNTVCSKQFISNGLYSIIATLQYSQRNNIVYLIHIVEFII